VTSYAFDEVGNRVSQTDANSHVTRFEFDKLGRQTKRILPDGKYETSTFDAHGRMTSRTDFMGRTTTFQHDQADRLTLKTYPDSSTNSFTYTATGRRLTAVDARGTTSYLYDQRDRPTQLTYPDGRRLNYGHDANGNRTALTATVGMTSLTTGVAFDDRSQVSTVTDPDGRVYTYGYNANGSPTSLAQPNGVTTTYTHDQLSRLTSLVSKHGMTTLASYAYTLGPTGLRTRVDEADGAARVYVHDALYRLTSETVTGAGAADYAKTFAYDSVGNRLSQVTTGAGAASVAYSFDARDRLLTETGITYTHDDNGNRISKSGDATYTWDFSDRLLRVSKSDGTVVDHVYDVDGNRVRTTVTPVGGPAVVTNFLVDTMGGLSQVVAETDGAGSIGAYYVRAGDELLAVRRAPVLACYLKDGLGSVRALTDATGAVTDTKVFSAFGETLTTTGTDPQPYGFAGEAFDSVSSLAYHRARWMDPSTGRFLSIDPMLGDPSALHAYTYASNAPTTLKDPTGLYTVAQLAIVSGIISGLTSATLTGLGGGNATQVVLSGVLGGIAGAGAAYFVGSAAALGAMRVAGILTGTQVAAISTAVFSGISVTGLAGLALDQSRPPAQRGFAAAAALLTVAVLVKANVNRTLTESEVAEIQALSDKFKTEIHVVGSRAGARGRNVETELPVGEGPRTRSDIDFRYDGQVDINTGGGFSEALIGVGGGAGRASFSSGTAVSKPPYIRFTPGGGSPTHVPEE